LEEYAKKWNIQKPEDWNKVTTSMVQKEGGNFLNYYNGSLLKGIVIIYTWRQLN
jgi:hypothetical protein